MTDKTFRIQSGTRIDMLNTLAKDGVCAELGVLKGDFSAEILKHCTPKRLYLVDLFRGNVESGDQNGANMAWHDMEHMRPKLETRFLDKPVTVVQRDDVNWLLEQPRGSLDWFYLDSLHEYDHVLAALLAGADAVKVGGVITGHDFHQHVFPGVTQAVTQFALRFGMDVEIWAGDKLPSFKIINRRRELRDYID